MPTRELRIAAFAIVALACAAPRRRKALTASVDQRRRRRSRAGISISIAMATTFRREAAASVTVARSSISNARPVTAPRARAASAIDWSAGRARLATPKPVETVGSYWPYAPTLFDYIRRAMPQNAPQSLSNDDVYAVSAYILNLNGLLPADATLDAKTLAAIKMPNRSMFVGDPRPDVKNPECMKGC